MNYTVDYFISKFEAIHEEDWCRAVLSNSIGQRCALGHCGVIETSLGDYIFSDEGTALNDLFYDTIKIGPMMVNDDVNEGATYNQPTPKQRILAALYDIKKMQEPEQPKREKIKVQISPDLIEPPIPKEVEKIDRPDEVIPLEEAAKDFQNSLDSYINQLQNFQDFLMESAYQGYKKARTGNHFLTPEFFEGIYKREDIEKFEARLKMEMEKSI